MILWARRNYDKQYGFHHRSRRGAQRPQSRECQPFDRPQNWQRSCLNALRHGLTGHTIVLPKEDLDAYHDFTDKFFAEFKPKGFLEKQLVQALADTSWRLNRIPALENNLMALGFSEHENNITNEHPEAHAAMVIIE